MMAADALIAEVAGNDEAWMDHIAEETQDDTPFGVESGILDGSLASV